MSRVPAVFVLLLVVLFGRSPVAVLAQLGDDQTAYELMEGYNFPIGLLPKGVTNYELDTSTGKFRVFLNETCSFSLEGSYDLKYKSTISGYISQNKLSSLTGVSVKVLFLWLNIVEVSRVDENIDFSVGIASATFPIDNFYECPQCGCGLDCNTVANGKGKTDKFSRSSLLALPA